MNFQRFTITAVLLAVLGISVGAGVATAPNMNFKVQDVVLPEIPAAPEVAPPTVVEKPVVAKVVLKAPATATIGQLVVLDVTDSIGESFEWHVSPDTGNFLVIDNGRRAVFSTPVGGDFVFTVGTALNSTVNVKIHTVRVPTGPVEPTAVDMAAKVASWCAAVNSPTKRDDALKLAQSFSAVAALADTREMTPDEIVQATIVSNRDALSGNLQNWVPFLQSLQAELKAQSNVGKLVDSKAHADAWKSIAKGLTDYADTMK